jgi:hypothetical protein
MTISSVRNACVPCVTTIGLSYVLSHLFKVDLLYYMSRGTKRKRETKKKRRENGTGKGIKNCCLARKMLLIDVM